MQNEIHCSVCGGTTLEKIITLGHQPPSDAFLRPADLNMPEVTYPLDLFYCIECSLVQIGYAVDPEKLFRDYVYTTGTNNALKENFQALANALVSRYKLTDEHLAVDVGSNDGTLLSYYLTHGVRVLGIDPSSSAQIAVDAGIPTIVDFFNKDVAARAASEHGKAHVITATNVFAHVVELDSFMHGILAMLSENGVFVSESAYVVDMVEQMSYDQIYHEHLRYYGLRPLAALFERFGMEIIDVERIKSHGGSIRVYAARNGAHQPSEIVGDLLQEEREKGFHDPECYRAFAARIVKTKGALLEILRSEKQAGRRIVGIGAPAKGNTLLNYSKIDTDLVDYLTEKSKLKIGLFSPGMHIPVVDEARLFEEQPENALILSWNIAEELIPKLRKGGYRGKFILPNPVPKFSDL